MSVSEPSSGSADYRYPDPGDRITALMIASISDPDRWRREEEVVLSALGAEIEKMAIPRSLLDVGAGEGRLLLHLRSLFERAVLVEPDRGRAQQISRNATVTPRLAVRVVARLEDVSPEPQYDVVVISHVLQHLPSDAVEPLVLRSAQYCRRDGLLYLATNLSSSEEHDFRVETVSSAGVWTADAVTKDVFDEVASQPASDLPIHFFPESYLRSVLHKAQFNALRVMPFHVIDVEADTANATAECRDIAFVGRKR